MRRLRWHAGWLREACRRPSPARCSTGGQSARWSQLGRRAQVAQRPCRLLSVSEMIRACRPTHMTPQGRRQRRWHWRLAATLRHVGCVSTADPMVAGRHSPVFSAARVVAGLDPCLLAISRQKKTAFERTIVRRSPSWGRLVSALRLCALCVGAWAATRVPLMSRAAIWCDALARALLSPCSPDSVSPC